MQSTDDSAWLREYAENNSEEAFAALVTKYINLVYSVAMRSVGNPASAEEITQAVFIILARKAGQLRNDKALSSWLFKTTQLTANNFLRSEMRRQGREQEAQNMQTILNEPEPELWPKIAPLLDNAVAALNEKDRRAILLRFYEGKNLREIGTFLGSNESAAEKRVSRALEKLRKFFTKRGVSSTTAIIAGTISANSVQAAPVALAKSVTAVAIAKGSIAAASTLTLVKGTIKMMTWMKIKFAATIGISAIVLATATIVVAQQIKSPKTRVINSVAAVDDSLLIVPHVCVGKVKAGMSEDDVMAVLGKPDGKQGEILIYDKQFGFSVVCSRQKIVGAVFCGDASGSSGSEIIKAFAARTKEGIGMDSSRDDLIKAFGRPASDKPWGVNQEQLDYPSLGLTFTLQQDKVIHIIVNLRKTQ